MNRGTIITIIIGVLILGALIGGTYGYKSWKERSIVTKIEAQLSMDPKTKDLMAAARDMESKISGNPNNPLPYLQAGLAWKGIADATGEKYFYQKALDAYSRGIKNITGENSVLYANAGMMAKEIGDYAAAEKFYRAAINASPGDPSNYISLIELYRYRLKKSEPEILALYDEAMSRLVNGYDVVAHRASYLRDIGRYQDAINDFELMLKTQPGSQAIKNEIAELKALLAQQKLKK